MADLEPRWYWCDMVDSNDIPEPPDFSKVPEERRAGVRERWLNTNAPEPERWKLWGPQVDHYRRMGFEVAVLEAAKRLF